MKHWIHQRTARHPEARWNSVPLALLWRYATHSLMVLMNFLSEGIPAPTLTDRILNLVPFVPIIARYNYHIWVLCYIPVAILLWYHHRDRFVQFLYTGGVVSLLRGVCIWLTILGPVNGRDVNAGRPWSDFVSAWLRIINPFSALSSDVLHVYLTKDLFFSGHTASTFLLLLYCWKDPRIRPFAIAGHVIVVSTVFLSHLHYAIDVVGGWAVAFCAYAAAEAIFRRITAKAVANPR